MSGAVRGPWAGASGEALAARWGVPRVECWTRIGSTNDRAAELARAENPRPLVVIAEEQTAGRGRRGSSWRSPPGSGIWMSLLLDRDRPPDPTLPLVVGVAAADAIEAVAGPEPRVAVKWPNDLLVEGRKVGGILCEGGRGGVVIGLGLDVTAESVAGDPALADIATALEVACAKPLDRSELAHAIVTGVLAAVARDHAFDHVREALAARDALRGRRVVSETHGSGVGAGIAEDGAFLLERDGERLRVTSGRLRLAPASGPA